MNNEQILMCVVALILGMLLANMLKSVCGCKVVEGQTFGCKCIPKMYGGQTVQQFRDQIGEDEYNSLVASCSLKLNATDNYGNSYIQDDYTSKDYCEDRTKPPIGTDCKYVTPLGHPKALQDPTYCEDL